MTRLHALPAALLMTVVVPFLWLDPALFTTPPTTDSSPGMVFAIDPDTGLPGMPTPEQMRRLFPAGTRMQQTEQGFIVEQRANGTVLVHVGSAMQEYTFVRVGPEGKLMRGCATPAPGSRTLTEIPPAPPLFEEK